MRASASLARSPLFATPSAVSPREAFILLTLVAHPGLLAGQAEMLAGLDFAHADTRRIRQALVDFDAHREADGESDAHAGIVASGLGDVLARLEAVVRHGDRWCLDSGADPDEVRESLKQAMTLHRRALTLHNELGLARSAFAQDESEASLAWIRDLVSQLSALDGTEAEIDRFSREATADQDR